MLFHDLAGTRRNWNIAFVVIPTSDCPVIPSKEQMVLYKEGQLNYGIFWRSTIG